MRAIPHITAQTLIWLSAVTVPVHGVLANSCRCSLVSPKRTAERSTQSDSWETGEAARSCCAGKVHDARPCCAVQEECSAFCQCGLNCQCHRDSEPQPGTPPVVDSAPKCAVGELVSTLSLQSTQAAGLHALVSVQSGAIASAECCAILCRFTL